MIKFKNCFPDLLDEADIKAPFLERYEDAFDDGAKIHDYYFEASDSTFGNWGRITTAMIEWEDETYYAIRRRGRGYLGKHRNVTLASDRILFGNQARAHNSLYKSWGDFSMIFAFWMREFENDAAWKEAVEVASELLGRAPKSPSTVDLFPHFIAVNCCRGEFCLSDWGGV